MTLCRLVFKIIYQFKSTFKAYQHKKEEPKQVVDITTPSKIMCSPPLTDAEWYTSGKPAPIFEGLDKLHYAITTKKS